MKTFEDIVKQVVKEVESFKTDYINIAEGYDFNQNERVHENIRFYNSKFAGSENDSEGFRKYFFNIVRNPCNSASKAIKIALKDIMIVPAPSHSDDKSWIMNLDFRYWARKRRFAQILNKIFRELPIQGSAVIKMVKGEPYFVDLRNLVNDQSADTLRDGSHIIEKHNYSARQFRKMKDAWTNVDKVLKDFKNSKANHIPVYERYGEVPEGLVKKGGGDDMVYARTIVYIPDSDYQKGQIAIGGEGIMSSKGIQLDIAEIKEDEFPYREFHIEKMAGRWLGVSRVEILRDPQIRTNEITNLRVKASYFDALTLFQTQDPNFKQDLRTSVANGDVLTTTSLIQRVSTEERGFAAQDLEERKWKGNADELAHNYDLVRGERMPAGTPLGSAQMAMSMISSYFEQIQEDVAAEIKDFIYNDIIPFFRKSNSQEHYLKLVGEDLDRYYKTLNNIKLNEEIKRFNSKNKTIPTQSQVAAIKHTIDNKPRNNRLRIPKNFYDDIKYDVDIVITGTDRNPALEVANISMALQYMQQDTEAFPSAELRRNLFRRMFAILGIDIPEDEQDAIEDMVMGDMRAGAKGGGISKPVIPQNLPIESTPIEV